MFVRHYRPGTHIPSQNSNHRATVAADVGRLRAPLSAFPPGLRPSAHPAPRIQFPFHLRPPEPHGPAHLQVGHPLPHVTDRYAHIQHLAAAHSTTTLCALLDVSRSGYCDWRDRHPTARQQEYARLGEEPESVPLLYQPSGPGSKLIPRLLVRLCAAAAHRCQSQQNSPCEWSRSSSCWLIPMRGFIENNLRERACMGGAVIPSRHTPPHRAQDSSRRRARKGRSIFSGRGLCRRRGAGRLRARPRW